MIENFEPGKSYRIHYATNCLVTSQPAFAERIIAIRSIRDMVTEPLTPEEFLRRPLLRRGRFLLKTKDPSRARFYRQLYAATSKEWWRDSVLRLGWYDPNQPGSAPVFKSQLVFHQTAYDRFTLARTLFRWKDREFDGLVLRVFCDDLRVRRPA